jgi:hypothetical protein
MAMTRKPRATEGNGNSDLIAEIKKRIVFFPGPPQRFDPRFADPASLQKYGLPPKPDRLREPERFAFWWRLFSPPLTFIEGEFAVPVPRYRIDLPQFLAIASTRHQASRNWSGAYITATRSRMFTEVQGEWQVPTPAPPTSASGAPPNDGDYRCSTWIGLDGQRLYFNSSLPQIGTTQVVTVVGGQPQPPTASAWWQWWVRDQTVNGPINIPLGVKPGDLVMCYLLVVSRMKVTFIIKNQTTGKTFNPIVVTAPQATMKHPPSPIQVQITGATAEWITERPATGSHLYDLADYGTVLFSNCAAVAAPAPGVMASVQRLTAAKLINMVKIAEHPHRTVKISVAEREGDQCVATFYRN